MVTLYANLSKECLRGKTLKGNACVAISVRGITFLEVSVKEMPLWQSLRKAFVAVSIEGNTSVADPE